MLQNIYSLFLIVQEWLESQLATEKSWNFYAYLTVLDVAGQKLDHCVPYLMSLFLGRKITIYNGTNIWNSDDESEIDICLGLAGGIFIPTKVGK